MPQEIRGSSLSPDCAASSEPNVFVHRVYQRSRSDGGTKMSQSLRRNGLLIAAVVDASPTPFRIG